MDLPPQDNVSLSVLCLLLHNLSVRILSKPKTGSKFHLPRNLLLALMGELGEVRKAFEFHLV